MIETSFLVPFAIRRVSRVSFAIFAVLTHASSLALTESDLQQAADRSNVRLPRMVAPNLRQERVAVNGRELTYSYTHLTQTAAQLQSMQLSTTQRPYIFPEICTGDTGQGTQNPRYYPHGIR